MVKTTAGGAGSIPGRKCFMEGMGSEGELGEWAKQSMVRGPLQILGLRAYRKKSWVQASVAGASGPAGPMEGSPKVFRRLGVN